MSNTNLKRELAFFEGNDQNRTYVKDMKNEVVRAAPRSSLKGRSFVETCMKGAHQKKLKQIAAKRLQTIKDFSRRGMNVNILTVVQIRLL